ncbi:protein of unknown function [Taphrina deformans PYCC 5710]|uniref:Uncharacterized protein n=1 Tax=Taphrina deformans (strain PYCC 5710 / ATCC 11124 / CBS 356.35 / IMI 108563 / JCM 9778 / NBRC 8474) TaxID=1097556 RepID=R4XE79_TAPDE|nr:protein of unknown function [Taphrina deformans PYCC 5710]|eukprot:CCG81662.1 protein of unknown function [Taphrina deformans PYCC 5710]
MVMWTPELDRALFIAILAQNPGLKIDADAIAVTLCGGRDLTHRAITERLRRLKMMVQGSPTSPTKPAVTGKRQKGMTGSPLSKILKSSQYDGDDD